jgi:senataxin
MQVSEPGGKLTRTYMLTYLINYSMTTSLREFEVLSRLPKYPICDAILRPRPAKIAKSDRKLVDYVMKDYGVNRSQAEAVIDSCYLEEGFLLIQGPPGTGKTKTILAIIAALKSAHISDSSSISSVFSVEEDTKKQYELPKVHGPLLVCAPSNAAIDEIVRRICTHKALQHLRVVRVGNPESVHGSVKDVSLDALLEAEIQKIERFQDGGSYYGKFRMTANKCIVD